MDPRPPARARTFSGQALKIRNKTADSSAPVIPAVPLVLAQAASKKTVQANEFILRDTSGRVRARASVEEKMFYDTHCLGQFRIFRSSPVT